MKTGKHIPGKRLLCASPALAAVFVLFFAAGCAPKRGGQAKTNALRALQSSQFARSVELFEAALEETTNDVERAEIYNYMGVACWKMDMPSHAYEAFFRSCEANPSAAEPVVNMGVMAMLSGNELYAMTLFETAAGMNASENRPLLFLADIHARRGQLPEARAFLDEALRRAPQSPDALTALAVLDLRSGDAAAAEKKLASALDIAGDYPPALFNVAEIHYYWNHSPSRALPYYKAFLRHAAADSYRIRANAAVEAIESGRGGEAAPDIPRPQSDPARTVPPQKPEDAMSGARAAAMAGKKSEAFNMFLRAASEAAAAGRGELEEKALAEAADSCPEDANALYSLGMRFYERRQYDRAAAQLKRAAALAPDRVDMNMSLAGAAMAADDPVTALSAAAAALKQQPSNAEAAWMIAVLYDARFGRPSDAGKAYGYFAERFPDDPRAEGARRRQAALSGRR